MLREVSCLLHRVFNYEGMFFYFVDDLFVLVAFVHEFFYLEEDAEVADDHVEDAGDFFAAGN